MYYDLQHNNLFDYLVCIDVKDIVYDGKIWRKFCMVLWLKFDLVQDVEYFLPSVYGHSISSPKCLWIVYLFP